MSELIDFVEQIKSRKKGKLDNMELSEIGIEILEKEIEFCNKIIEILKIQKPEITEQFLSDKAKLFVYAIMPNGIEPTRSDIYAAKEFLRSLFKEMK